MHVAAEPQKECECEKASNIDAKLYLKQDFTLQQSVIVSPQLKQLQETMESLEESESSECLSSFLLHYQEACDAARAQNLMGPIYIGNVHDFPDTDFLQVEDKHFLIRFGEIYAMEDASGPHSGVQAGFNASLFQFFQIQCPGAYVVEAECDYKLTNINECHAQSKKCVDLAIIDTSTNSPIAVGEVGVFREDVYDLLIEASMCLNSIPRCQYFYAIKVETGRRKSIRIMLCKKQRKVSSGDGQSPCGGSGVDGSENQSACRKPRKSEKKKIKDFFSSGGTGDCFDITVISNEIFYEGDRIRIPFPSVDAAGVLQDNGDFIMVDWMNVYLQRIFPSIEEHLASRK